MLGNIASHKYMPLKPIKAGQLIINIFILQCFPDIDQKQKEQELNPGSLGPEAILLTVRPPPRPKQQNCYFRG